ncbi:hypothetical protein Tco_0199460 [Tanacetum coccineum]
MPKVEKYVTESLGAEVLARSSNQPQRSYAAADLFASYSNVVTLKRGRDNQDKDKEPSAGSNRGTKRRRPGKEESSKEATQKESKSTSSSKGATGSQPKSSGKSAQAEEHGPRVDDLEEPSHQKFETRNDDVSPAREVIDVDTRLWNLPGSQTPDHDMDRNHLMRTDELHKFNDGTLNHVRTALNDIATGIQIEYLPKRKWTKQDNQRA